MMNTWKPNLEEAKRHYIDWWNHKGIVVNMWEHFQQGVTPHADVPAPPPCRDLNQRWFDPQWRADYLDWYVAHSSLMADILPVANTQLGPGSLAAILGGVFEGGEDTIWIHPNPHFTDDITLDPQHPNWLLHKELLQACKRKAQGHYYVGMPDLMEGLDVLAALKGTDKVLLDTVMQPELLERQLQQVNDIYFRVFDELYDIIREGDEMAFCYFSLWAPGRMSKLQCDLSTMISQDDYRRFVQPFIRQQCQRIDYTLYHLDGVGAMHHLDALLEIDELDAIQWTPGVGEPQGGSPKWYDLYRRILAAGKSIMACWVTLDELRPLLDNIGADGVHLEMDFHNEREVEQALRIVEEYRKPTPTPSRREGKPTPNPSRREGSFTVRFSGGMSDEEADRKIDRIIQEIEGSQNTNDLHNIDIISLQNIEASNTNKKAPLPSGGVGGGLLLLDGAMGTMIQQYHLREEDFRGCRFAQHPTDLRGCNDVLVLTAPFVVADIHRKYLKAGADIIETNTFNAQSISLGDYGLQQHVRDINIAAARLARQCADEFSTPDKPRYVAGSIGPTNRTIVSEKIKGTGEQFATALREAYTEQIEALRDGGVDLLLVETIFDVENARIAIEAARTVAPQLPIMLSFNVSTPDGHNMLGQDVLDFLQELTTQAPAARETDGEAATCSWLFSVGINCVTDIAKMSPLIKQLARFGTRVSLYPNAGQPDSSGVYHKTPKELVADLWPLLQYHHLSIVGGCCGTTDAHIRMISSAIEPIEGIRLSGVRPTPKSTPTQREVKPTPTPSRREGSLKVSNGGENIVGNKTNIQAPLPSGGDGGGLGGDGSGLFLSILSGKSDDAVAATREAIAAGAVPQDLINGQMIRAMSEVGRRFQDGKAFVPQLLMAGRAMKAALELLKPLMVGEASTAIGKVVIGTVKGDLHDIGKNLVASMLEGCGFEVVNIGIDVSADKFIEAVKENQPDILCMSALLTTTMGYMKEVIDALEAAGIRQQVKVMVGGAPVTQGFADEIGADGYSDNANSAVTVAKQLLHKSV